MQGVYLTTQAKAQSELEGFWEEGYFYELMRSETTEAGEKYRGKAEFGELYFTAPPEELPFLEDIAIWLLEWFVKNIKARGGTILELKIYRAEHEWYDSRWKVEVWTHGSPFTIASIIGLLAIAVIVIGVTLSIWRLTTVDWGSPAGVLMAGAGIGLLLILGIFLVSQARRKKPGGGG